MLVGPNDGVGVTTAGLTGSAANAGGLVSLGTGLETEGRMLGRLGGLVTGATAIIARMARGFAFGAFFFRTGAFLAEALVELLRAAFRPAGLRAAFLLAGFRAAGRFVERALLFARAFVLAGALFFGLLDFADAFLRAAFLVAIDPPPNRRICRRL